MKQQIDTSQVQAVANQLEGVNNTLSSSVAELRTQAGQLDRFWNGKTGAYGTSRFYALIQSDDSRSAVLQNYINFLRGVTIAGYEKAEDVDTRLADMFK